MHHPGQTTTRACLSNNQDIELDLDRIETPHEIRISSFIDHIGNTRDLTNLSGGGVYAELAHPDSKNRHFNFFVNWSSEFNELFLNKTVFSYISEHDNRA